MKSLDVCLSPDLIHLYDLKGKITVAVDILRATSSITTGMAHGIEAIVPFASLDDCRGMRVKGYYIAGERGGQKVEDFDIGNSPFSYMEDHLKGEKVAVTTTNGTQVIELSAGSEEIIIGSFLNITAVTKYLKNKPNDVLIFCAGWKGHVNLEDTLFAGALASMIESGYDFADDAVLVAKSLYKENEDDILHLVEKSSHAKRLNKFNVTRDIEFCLTRDKFDVVPVLREGKIIDSRK